MKFLKKYKVFEKNIFGEDTEFDGIKQELEDILQEMKDEFKPRSNNYPELPVDIRNTFNSINEIISIRIGKELAELDDYSLNMRDIQDTLLRINDYMESEGYHFKTFAWDNVGTIKFSYTEFGPKQPFESILKVPDTVYLAIFYIKKVID
jgi:hypothetical protein